MPFWHIFFCFYRLKVCPKKFKIKSKNKDSNKPEKNTIKNTKAIENKAKTEYNIYAKLCFYDKYDIIIKFALNY